VKGGEVKGGNGKGGKGGDRVEKEEGGLCLNILPGPSEFLVTPAIGTRSSLVQA